MVTLDVSYTIITEFFPFQLKTSLLRLNAKMTQIESKLPRYLQFLERICGNSAHSAFPTLYP